VWSFGTFCTVYVNSKKQSPSAALHCQIINYNRAQKTITGTSELHAQSHNFDFNTNTLRSQHQSLDHGLDNRGSIPGRDRDFLLFATASGTGKSLSGSKAAGAWSWSPPSSAEAQNAWSYTSTAPIRLHGVVRETFNVNYILKSRDSSVGIALGYGPDDRGSRVWLSVGAGNFSLHHRVKNGSGAHPASYPIGTRDSFPRGNAVGAWSWPLTSIQCRGQECVELYLQSSNMVP
jgi:hypothetical protein